MNSDGVWGSGATPQGLNLSVSDVIGVISTWVQAYQQSVTQCSLVFQQTMFIDAYAGPVSYHSGSPYGATNQLGIDVDTAPGKGICVTVNPNGGTTATSCKDVQ